MSPQIINPATEEFVADVKFATLDEMDQAIDRAVQARESWRAVSPADRARLLTRFAGVVDAHVEDLAQLEVANSGHPIANARWEAQNVRDVLAYYAGAPERHAGRQIPVAGGVDLTFYEPIGVVGLIVPWNFPLPIAGWGLAPALAAGNTVVMKPAPTTPLTAMRLAELGLEAGLPEGVFQVVPGDGPTVGYRLVTHPEVGKVCFTGSTATGRQVMTGAAQHIKRFTLELGGKSANIIFADCDVELAAATAPLAVFDNAGQDCCARSRILVHDTIYEQFMEQFETAVHRVRVMDPTKEASQMGPLISQEHRQKVANFVDDAQVAFRGHAPTGKGWWFAPTVIEETDLSSASYREEIFGPVVSVVRFHDESEAVTMANDTPYGLSGSIWTRDVARALRVARNVQAGVLSVNSHSSVRYSTPFGGYKQSGIGRELGPDALLSFSEEKNVFIATE